MTGNPDMLIYSGHCEIVGGDAKYLTDLVNALDPSGQKIAIATDINPSFEKFAAQHLSASVDVSYLNTRPILFRRPLRRRLGRYGRGVVNVMLFSRFRECVWNFMVFYKFLKNRGAGADIFHFNNGGYPAKEAGVMALLAARLLGKKTVMSFHNMPVKRTPLRPSDYFFDTVVSHSCDVVIAASDALRSAIVRDRRMDPKRVRTIYCGLKDEAPLPRAECLNLRRGLGISETAPVLLICGNLDEDRKGHLPLFKALCSIKAAFPDVVLLVVGTGSGDRVRYLKNAAQDLGIGEIVRFLGSRSDIHALNCMADVAVVPSLLTEATPYTIKEAARAGRPVVTTTVGGCAEGVEEGKTGYVVAPNDPGALSAAIIGLLQDAPLRSTMGQNARALFLKKFLLSEKVKQHEEIYEQLRSQL